jgi:hypothetical protein
MLIAREQPHELGVNEKLFPTDLHFLEHPDSHEGFEIG